MVVRIESRGGAYNNSMYSRVAIDTYSLQTFVAYDPNTAADNLWLIRMLLARMTGRAVPILTKTEIDELLQSGYDNVFVGFWFFVLRKKLTNYNNSLVIPETEWRQCYVIDFKPSVPYYYLAPLDYPTVIPFHSEKDYPTLNSIFPREFTNCVFQKGYEYLLLCYGEL